MDIVRYAGPADARLTHNEIEGYQPITRLGECVINARIDATEWTDNKGPWYLWASVLPGMIAVNKLDKPRTRSFGDEATLDVIVSCADLERANERQYTFAGITRSKSILSPDDGLGPSVDEPFTLSIKGCANILNNGGKPITPGMMVKWHFVDEKDGTPPASKRPKIDGKRNATIILVSPADTHMDRNVIGRALSYARPGERLDILIM
jgi:hypothetical protein